MLNFEQQDALGNLITVLSRYGASFKEDLWEVFKEYSPHRDFSISGSQYYKALSSIPDSIKTGIVIKIISVFKFESFKPDDVFGSLAYLNVCGTPGYFLMRIVSNLFDFFKPVDFKPIVWIRTLEEDGVNGVTIHFDSDMQHSVMLVCYDNEIYVNIKKNLLRQRYPFADFPENHILQLISRELIEKDDITEKNSHFMRASIDHIDAINDRSFNQVDFIIQQMHFINTNAASLL